MTIAPKDKPWPDIPFEPWVKTHDALHLWSQIIGKYRLALTPWMIHSWHATLYITPRGLTTGPIPNGADQTILTLDLCDHIFIAETTGGRREAFALEAMSIAEFHRRVAYAVEGLGQTFAIHGSPNEIKDAVPFVKDTVERPYDRDAVERFHAALIRIESVFSRFRTSFLGKSSPVHLFWGSFDLAVTRFSGREAPPHPGGVPNLPDSVTREAYSHEVSSAGFWAGAGAGEPMFYSYCYPTPDAFSGHPVFPEAAYWSKDLGEFLLPYEAVRRSDDPEETLLHFLQSTYEAAAITGKWDRAALECALGEPGVPRIAPQ
ncbi:MAG: DUF5996 family protein [Pseudomonadota bacterium]